MKRETIHIAFLFTDLAFAAAAVVIVATVTYLTSAENTN